MKKKTEIYQKKEKQKEKKKGLPWASFGPLGPGPRFSPGWI